MTKPIIIAVDGPAGSGKSSLCKKVCEKLGWNYINTGLLYRSIAYLAQKENISLNDQKQVGVLVDNFAKDFTWNADEDAILFGGTNISPFLLNSEVSSNASKVAQNPLVREKLLPVQRKMASFAPLGVMMDGRDIGSVVFPDADVKVFVTASIEERARRRFEQLKTNGQHENMEIIKQSIRDRDEQDSNRTHAPLIKVADALEFDNSQQGMNEAIDAFIKLLKTRVEIKDKP